MTAQDDFLDAMVRHRIETLRVARGIAQRSHLILDRTESRLRAAVRDRLRGHTGLTTPRRVLRLNRVLEQIRKIRGRAHGAISKMWTTEMNRLALTEPKLVDGILKTTMPVRFKTKLPTKELLRSIVKTRPFEGAVLKEWSKKFRASDMARIEGQIRIGLVQGETSKQIARRITGTVRLRGRNGVTEITRRGASAIVETATTGMTNQARREYAPAVVEACLV